MRAARVFDSPDLELTVARTEREAARWCIHAEGPDEAEVGLTVEVGPDRAVLRSAGDRSDRFLHAMAQAYDVPLKAGARMATETSFTFLALEGATSRLGSSPVKLKLFHEGEPYCELYLNLDLARGLVDLREKDADYRAPLVRLLTQVPRRRTKSRPRPTGDTTA